MVPILTYSGRVVDLDNLRPQDICKLDIAHHLALINRYSGATRTPYTVAQHSCLTARIAQSLAGPEAGLYALLHDAHEAYVNDVISPLKKKLIFGVVPLGELCSRIDYVIREAFSIPKPSIDMVRVVKKADAIAFATECRDLLPGQMPKEFLYQNPDAEIVVPIPWEDAEVEFMNNWYSYTNYGIGIVDDNSIPVGNSHSP